MRQLYLPAKTIYLYSTVFEAVGSLCCRVNSHHSTNIIKNCDTRWRLLWPACIPQITLGFGDRRLCGMSIEPNSSAPNCRFQNNKKQTVWCWQGTLFTCLNHGYQTLLTYGPKRLLRMRLRADHLPLVADQCCVASNLPLGDAIGVEVDIRWFCANGGENTVMLTCVQRVKLFRCWIIEIGGISPLIERCWCGHACTGTHDGNGSFN